MIIGFGHPVYTVSDPRNQVIKEVARTLSQEAGDMKMFDIAERIESVMMAREEDVPEPRLVPRRVLSPDGRADRDVHAAVRHRAHHRLGARTSSSSAPTTRSSARPRTTSGPENLNVRAASTKRP